MFLHALYTVVLSHFLLSNTWQIKRPDSKPVRQRWICDHAGLRRGWPYAGHGIWTSDIKNTAGRQTGQTDHYDQVTWMTKDILSVLTKSEKYLFDAGSMLVEGWSLPTSNLSFMYKSSFTLNGQIRLWSDSIFNCNFFWGGRGVGIRRGCLRFWFLSIFLLLKCFCLILSITWLHICLMPSFNNSATWPPGVRRLSQKYMKDPIFVNVGSLDLSVSFISPDTQSYNLCYMSEKPLRVSSDVWIIKQKWKLLLLLTHKIRLVIN